MRFRTPRSNVGSSLSQVGWSAEKRLHAAQCNGVTTENPRCHSRSRTCVLPRHCRSVGQSTLQRLLRNVYVGQLTHPHAKERFNRFGSWIPTYTKV